MDVYRFPGTADAPISEVGGKGWSLIKTSAAGLPVPPGYVLPLAFFRPWIERITASPSWQRFLATLDTDPAPACAELKNFSYGLEFTSEQRACLAKLTAAEPAAALWAVRSSSPEEDLEGSSFAGGYETILGVNRDRLEEAIHQTFASCLDLRIVIYKRQAGFSVTDPKIAVVVQKQIASDVSGVGFSLNPLSNDFDEAVFNSNWGLGETVVSGTVTADTFIVNKVSKKVLERRLGKKETSIWLLPEGSTVERVDDRHNQLTLSDRLLRSLSNLITQVETFYKQPIDIEWACAGGQLYLLQARPITTYVPLLPAMVTPPGARRLLYLDATISVQALFKPLSVMGTSVLETALKSAGKRVGTALTGQPQKSIAFACGGRLYVNLSVVIGILGARRLSELLVNMDPLAASVIAALDENSYKKPGLPLALVFILRNLLASFTKLARVNLAPRTAHKRAQQKLQQLEANARVLSAQNLPLRIFVGKLMDLVLRTVSDELMPIVGASRAAVARMKQIAGKTAVAESDLRKLEQGLPHNVTTEMGLALYDVSLSMPADMNVETFMSKLPQGGLPADLERAWQNFITRYGHRGAGELDIASPRYRDNPRLLVEQLVALRRSTSTTDNPKVRFETACREREAVYESVSMQLRDARKFGDLQNFQHLYKVVVELAGYRETPKFYLIFMLDLIRRRLLSAGEALVDSGRLDLVDQIFDLTLDAVMIAQRDPKIDLRVQCRKNREFLDKLSRVPSLPTLIDSRGKILRPPPRPVGEGEVAGTAISPGVARGPIKVLHSADEKPLKRGDILVARATDPGWTPLFVNCAAVILEIGGMLQHGALVAREYGLPCVSGIPDATSLWEDGTMVEVDGSAGTIRRL